MSDFFKHDFHPSILRAYDIRGIIDETLTTDDAFAIGAGFAHILGGKGKKIAVGYDGRLSSPELAEALINGLIASGAVVLQTGLGPTPQLYYADILHDCDGAIQITGSHNPPNYNGFKMVRGHASFFADDITSLGALMAKGITLTHDGSQQKVPVADAYISRLLDDVDCTDDIFVWDTGNGAAGPSVRALISQMTGTHHLLFEEVDGTFPNHHPDPVDPHTLGFLRDACKTHDALAGLGFDGDGDRLGMIDGKGRQVPGDILTAFLAQDFLQSNPGETILFDVKSSISAMKLVEQAGGKAELWKTGHSHMKAKMKETGCQLAGEMSGHIFIGDGYFGYDDALYVAVRTLRAMKQNNQTITEFMDSLPASHTTPECRVPCDDDVKFSVMAGLADYAKSEFQNCEVIVIDGIRVQDENGWWLIRASNTEACLVARAEGMSEAALAKKMTELESCLATQAIDWKFANKDDQ